MRPGVIDELIDLLGEEELRQLPAWVAVWLRAGAMTETEAVAWRRKVRGRLVYLDLTDDSSLIH